MGIVGMATMIGIAWFLSSDRARVPWRLVGFGVTMQAIFGFVVLKTAFGRVMFQGANRVFAQLLGFTEVGARFIFGNLVKNNVPVGQSLGQPADMALIDAGAAWANTGAYFAFFVLPTIIFFSALTSVLYHLGILQRIVGGIAWAMRRTLRTSGAETLCVAGNIFVGMTEAPLMIKPFIGRLTLSELNTVMVGGFATIAGGVMAAYVGMLSPYFPDIAGHLLTASVMNAPAALVISKLLVPETGEPETSGGLAGDIERNEANVIDAAATGASQGMQLALNVGAMLLAFVALLALLNFVVGAAGGLVGADDLTLQSIFGWILAPVIWLMGLSWGDATIVGSLVGVKVVATEFVAYLQLSGMMEVGGSLSPRGAVIATYALLGFANIPSIAIQIGGIGGIAPERRGDLARLGVKAMIGGNLAALMSASLAGLLL
ncbi:MAG: NupC/NupG family nucleoside CNT transporter [Gemmatimonadetes bacterium]|nr:NupC/NupG family nucleoside CNT transporter [Gemmatimonadota bacterium]